LDATRLNVFASRYERKFSTVNDSNTNAPFYKTVLRTSHKIAA
jgi:hypothetical protein